MPKYQRQCQSCGMPLKNGEFSGTEANGEKSTMYCHYCYINGQFIQPEMTIDEMKIVVDNALKENGWIKPLRWLSLKQIPTLARWKQAK